MCRAHDRSKHRFDALKRNKRRRKRGSSESTGRLDEQINYFELQVQLPNSYRNTLHRKVKAATSAEAAKDEKDKDKKDKASVVKQISQGYESLVMAIVRPPRSKYEISDLGSVTLAVGGGLVMRRNDFSFENRRGMRIQASQWCPAFVADPGRLPCVVYLHGNSSSRMDIVRARLLRMLSFVGCTVIGFDFGGSGRSEGENVTLGYYEQDDVADLLAHVRSKGWGDRFTLWGRSMGAASATLFTAKYGAVAQGVLGVVLDSPFASFRQLCMDLVRAGQVKVPKVALRAAMMLIRRSVKKRTGADINKLSPVKACKAITCPVLIIAAQEDKMVPPSHGEALLDSWGAHSHLIKCKGGHNSVRQTVINECIEVFIKASFRPPDPKTGPSHDAIDIAYEAISEKLTNSQAGQSMVSPREINVTFSGKYEHKKALSLSSLGNDERKGRLGRIKFSSLQGLKKDVKEKRREKRAIAALAAHNQRQGTGPGDGDTVGTADVSFTRTSTGTANAAANARPAAGGVTAIGSGTTETIQSIDSSASPASRQALAEPLPARLMPPRLDSGLAKM
ncbi:unnamed protein product [Chrysoparadoxa australica]